VARNTIIRDRTNCLAVLVLRQKHTDFPSAENTEDTVRAARFFPHFAIKATGFFLIVFGSLRRSAASRRSIRCGSTAPTTRRRSPPPRNGPVHGCAGGRALRLFPSWEIRLWGHTVPPIFWAAVVLPTLMIVLALVYAWLEARMTGDHARHNLLQRPRDNPVRTGPGAMALAFTLVLFVSGGNDVFAKACTSR
jgi:quinol---cytochrome-c reductase cytochrome b subunit